MIPTFAHSYGHFLNGFFRINAYYKICGLHKLKRCSCIVLWHEIHCLNCKANVTAI